MFDEDLYLLANPDVATAVRSGVFKSGFAHYLQVGKSEGRPLTCNMLMTRQEKVLTQLNKNGVGLEIGPSHNPIAPKREGFNVHILDHLDQQSLKSKYAGHIQYGVNVDNIEEVDFVWQGQPLSNLIGQTNFYDWIIASHVIEHIPDLVTFFQQCELLLKADGLLSLVIPDKRYCFDSLNACSSTGEFLDAFDRKSTRPSPGMVFDHFANASKRDKKIAWSSNEIGAVDLVHTFDQARSFWNQARGTDTYIDVHCWRFTPESFRQILNDFKNLGILNLDIVAEFPTSGCEFYVTLGKITTSIEAKSAANDRLFSLQARNSIEFN